MPITHTLNSLKIFDLSCTVCIMHIGATRAGAINYIKSSTSLH